MICDGQGCSVIAHLNCYCSAGSQDANDAITDIEHWQCEKCGGLPRHMHLRPRAAKRARVSFDPDLDVVTESPTIEGGLATGLQGGGWGGHWPTRVETPQPITGNGKETMDPPIKKCKRTPETPAARLHLEEAAGSKGKAPLTPLPNEPPNTGMTITKTSQVTTADDMTIDILDSSTPPTPIIPMPTTEAPTRRRAPRKSGHQRQFAKTHGAWRTPKPPDARAPDPT